MDLTQFKGDSFYHFDIILFVRFVTEGMPLKSSLHNAWGQVSLWLKQGDAEFGL
jgi:hypothetical protein